jgi:hypothetical protein
MAVLNLTVDFRSRRFAFRGRPGEPPRRFTPAGSPLTRASRRSLRAFHSNQQGLKSLMIANTAIQIKTYPDRAGDANVLFSRYRNSS